MSSFLCLSSVPLHHIFFIQSPAERHLHCFYVCYMTQQSLSVYPQNVKTLIHKVIRTLMFIETLFMIELSFKLQEKNKICCARKFHLESRHKSHLFYKSPLPGHAIINGTSCDPIRNTNVIPQGQLRTFISPSIPSSQPIRRDNLYLISRGCCNFIPDIVSLFPSHPRGHFTENKAPKAKAARVHTEAVKIRRRQPYARATSLRSVVQSRFQLSLDVLGWMLPYDFVQCAQLQLKFKAGLRVVAQNLHVNNNNTLLCVICQVPQEADQELKICILGKTLRIDRGKGRKLYQAEEVEPQCNCNKGPSLSCRELRSFLNYLEFEKVGWTFIHPVQISPQVWAVLGKGV